MVLGSSSKVHFIITLGTQLVATGRLDPYQQQAGGAQPVNFDDRYRNLVNGTVNFTIGDIQTPYVVFLRYCRLRHYVDYLE